MCEFETVLKNVGPISPRNNKAAAFLLRKLGTIYQASNHRGQSCLTLKQNFLRAHQIYKLAGLKNIPLTVWQNDRNGDYGEPHFAACQNYY